MAQQGRAQLLAAAGILVQSAPEGAGAAPCPQCGGPMRVRKTLRRPGQTLAHGLFRACETVRVCARGCTRKVTAVGGKTKAIAVTRRSETLAQILLPRRAVGYDVMAFVGRQRFVEHRQREEIQGALKANFGLALSTGQLSTLAHDFLVYLEALHHRRAPELRAALEEDGGWPMHIDATGEDGQGTLLAVYAGWRGWVLGSWKIPTERADAILPRLREVADRFGNPCAIMRDLGRAMIEASRDFVAHRGLQIPVLGCHFHFLKDVGKDLLEAGHDQLRAQLRRFNVRGHLRALARDLGRQLGTDIETARSRLERWLAEGAQGHALPDGPLGIAVVRALAQWILDYPTDGNDEGFPFDLPYLDLLRRCSTALRAVEAFLCTPHPDDKVRKLLERLHRIVEPVRSQVPFQHLATVLGTRARLFAELRQALRLRVKGTADDSSAVALASANTLGKLRDVQRAVEDLAASLRERRPERGPAQDTRQAIDLVLTHLDRHGPSLWGHAIALPDAVGGGTRLVARSNLLLEAFFHRVKHGERRRSGRKTLTQDLENLPGAALLATNLTKPDYVEKVCGDLDQLPIAFARLDADDRRVALPVRTQADPQRPHDVVSASLPAADRHIIRSDGLHNRLLAAATSRAPRRLPTGKPRAATVG